MNLVYFTSGHGVLDGDIRRQVLRIPEVLGHLNKAPSSTGDSWDVWPSLLLDEEFAKLEVSRRVYLINLIQQGLFERFCRLRVPYVELLRRASYVSPQAVANEMNLILGPHAEGTVYVIGPGLDEVPLLVRQPRVEFVDIIDQDPALHWFWPELRRVAQA